jgi:hypothetical protein
MSAPQPDYYTVAEMAQMLGMGEHALRCALSRRATWLPPSILFGKNRRFPRRAYEAWDKAQNEAALRIQQRRRGRPRKPTTMPETLAATGAAL